MRFTSLGRSLLLAAPGLLLCAAPAIAQPGTPPAGEPPVDEAKQPSEQPDGSATPYDDSATTPKPDAEPPPPDGAQPPAGPPPPVDPTPPPPVVPTPPPTAPPPPPLLPPPPPLLPPPGADSPPAATAAVIAEAPPETADGTYDITDDLKITPSGQYLLRYRHEEGKDFVNGGITNYFRHRARLGMEAMYANRFGVFLQLQDVRTFGEESHTLFDYNADGFDLHQAYLRVLPIEQIEMRLGRQEIAYENHRLIGTVGWLEQARSFDALRGIIKPDEMVAIDLFYARTGEDHALTLLPDGSRAHMDDKDVIATNVHVSPMKELEVGFTFMVDIDANDAVQKRKYTAGGIVTGKTDIGLSYGAEGYYQFGRADNDPAAGHGVTYSAWLVAARAQMDIKVPTKPFVGAFGDFLSGDSDTADDTFRTFDVPYATNHKFYGEMDFFLNSVAHTQQRGLADLGGVVGFKPFDGAVAKVTYHHFKGMAGRDGEIDADGNDTELDTFGNEVDLKLAYSPWKPLTFDWMYGFFVPGDIKRCMPGPTGACTTPATKTEHFIYSTVSAKF